MMRYAAQLGIAILLLSAMGGGAMRLARAAPPESKVHIEKFEFSQKTNSAYAMTQARKAYNELQTRIDPTYIPTRESEDFKASARFMPLDKSDSFEFLGLYIFNAPGGQECLPSGCDITIFKKSPRSWNEVLSVTAHEVWIGESPSPGTPRDLLLKTYPVFPWQPGDNQMGLWRWKDGKYQFLKMITP